MKLLEISTEVSKHQFVSVIGSLIPELHNIASTLEQMIDDGHGDIAKRQLASRQARWFSANYPKVLSAANALKGVNPVFSKIAAIGVSGYTASSGKTDLTKGNGYAMLISLVFTALDAIGAGELGGKLKAAIARCDELVFKGREEQKAAKEFKPKNDVGGKQNAAVEAIVSQAIKSMPTSLQHKARIAVSKADNKLKALQAFIAANQ